MIFDKLFNTPATLTLKKGIEGTGRRHQAITNNIANVDTPNYQRATVSFEKSLRRARLGLGFSGKTPNARHFDIGGPMMLEMVHPKVNLDNNTRFRPDRNNINIDEEAAALAKNTMDNLAFTELLSRRYRGITTTIREASQR